ncbi:MAG: hypothetical protein DHS20C02_19480 [Micavibrio sp.]|nr:MAG: hypothetical protein DHS20C02_19480 [Micavibrio sp.]
MSAPLLLGGFGLSVFFIGTDSILFAPAVISLLLFAAITLYPNFKDGWGVPKTSTVAFVGLFWLWLFLGHFWSSVPNLSTFFTILISVLPALFLVLILAPEPQKSLRVHAMAVGIMIGAFALWALIQFFFLFETYGPRIHHPMLNPNNLAGLFEMALLPALAMFFASKERKSTILSGLALLVFYSALIVTQSRGAFVACAMSACVLLPFVLWGAGKTAWKKFTLVVVMVGLVPTLINVYGNGVLHGNLMGLGNFMELHSVVDRLLLWGSTWEMVKDNFWLGTGLGTFFYYYPGYRDHSDLSDGFFAHMDPLQLWAETGVLTYVLFYGILICVLLRTITAARAASNERLKLQIMGTFCGMLALSLHTHLTFHLYMPGILVPLATLLAYWYIKTEKALDDGYERVSFVPSRATFLTSSVAVSLVVIVIGGWCVRSAAAIHIMNEVTAKTYTGEKEIARAKMEQVKFWAPDSYERYFEYEARFRIDDLWGGIRKMNPEKASQTYEEAIYFLDEAEKRNPAHTRIWDLRARLYMIVDGVFVQGGTDKAAVLFARVIKANPLAVDTRVALANLYSKQGELDKALAVLEDGTRWPAVKGQPDVNFLTALAQVKMQMGDKVAHDRIIEEARKRAIRYGLVAN